MVKIIIKKHFYGKRHGYSSKSEITGMCRESKQDFNSFIHLVMRETVGHDESGKLVHSKITEYSIASVG